MDDPPFIATCEPGQEFTSLNLQNLSYVSTCLSSLNMPDYNIILMDTIQNNSENSHLNNSEFEKFWVFHVLTGNQICVRQEMHFHSWSEGLKLN